MPPSEILCTIHNYQQMKYCVQSISSSSSTSEMLSTIYHHLSCCLQYTTIINIMYTKPPPKCHTPNLSDTKCHTNYHWVSCAIWDDDNLGIRGKHRCRVWKFLEKSNQGIWTISKHFWTWTKLNNIVYTINHHPNVTYPIILIQNVIITSRRRMSYKLPHNN